MGGPSSYMRLAEGAQLKLQGVEQKEKKKKKRVWVVPPPPPEKIGNEIVSKKSYKEKYEC